MKTDNSFTKNHQDFFAERINPFKDVEYIYYDTMGYLVWRTGTGGNVEILHLRSFELRKGHATTMMKQMVGRIRPYHSVFVFVRKGNIAARRAYESFGFKMTEVPDLYRDGGTLIGTATHNRLRKTLGV